MKCGYCTRELDGSAKFCTYCGSVLQEGAMEDGAESIVPVAPVAQAHQKPVSERSIQTALMDAISFRTVNYGPRGCTLRQDGRQQNTRFSGHA